MFSQQETHASMTDVHGRRLSHPRIRLSDFVLAAKATLKAVEDPSFARVPRASCTPS